MKKMQMEKERLERVDLENARLLGRIKQLGQRKGREFSRSSAAEDVLPLVLKRRKRERNRKNRLLLKSNQLLKDRIDKIKSGPGSNLSQNNKNPVPPRHSRKKFQTLSAAKFSHRKFRLSNKQFDAIIQSRESIKNSSKSSISIKEKWHLVYKCGSRFQTNPVGAKTRPFLISVYQTMYEVGDLPHKIIAQEKSAIRVVARDVGSGLTFKKLLTSMDLQVFFGGFKYFHPTMFQREKGFKRLKEIYFKAIVWSLKLEKCVRSKAHTNLYSADYLDSKLVLVRPPAVIGFRGSAVVRHVSTLNARYEKNQRREEENAQTDTFNFSPRINRSIIVSKLSPRNTLEKEKMLSARKAVLREVLSHTQSVSSGMMIPEHSDPNDVEVPEHSDPKGGELQGSPGVPRRLRSRQRQQRQKRGQERKALLHKQILKSTTRKENGIREVTKTKATTDPKEIVAQETADPVDIDMENEEEKKAVLKIQAIQRGRSQRKKIEIQKAELLNQKRRNAAIKIQSLIRGVKGRVIFSEVLEESHMIWKRDYQLRAVFKDGDLNDDGKLQVREFAAMLRNVSNVSGGGQAPTPSLVDIKKLMRRINAQYGIGLGENNGGKVEIGEDCFVEYFMSGLRATPHELSVFARGGQYHEMLATLVTQMRNEVLRRETEERLAASYAIFDKYDEDRSGEIDLHEMKQLISDYMGKRGRKYAPTEREVQALMNSLDQSGDGLMDREEFQRFLMGGLARTISERRQYGKKSKMHRKLAILLDRISLGIDRRTKALHKMFDSVDDDKSGFLTATEFRGLMAKYSVSNGDIPSDADVIEFMDIIDENGDARLSKGEFVLFMLHNDDLVDENDSMIGKWRKLALENIPW